MKVGDKIYLKPINNAARGGNIQIVEVEVTKVAKKFLYVTPDFYGRFFIDGMLQDGGQYCSNYAAYNTLQEIEDEKELYRNIGTIELNIKKINLNASRDILKIMGLTPSQS